MGLNSKSFSRSSEITSCGPTEHSLLIDETLPVLGESDVYAIRKKKYTCHQKLVFFNFSLVNFCSAMCVSLQAPFYPEVAMSKGISKTQNGLVFGIFELVVFVVSPFYGKYMRTIGPKFMINAGIFITAICCILFGFVNLVPSGNQFFILSLAIRIVAALGEAGFITASNTVIVHEFSDSVGTTFAIMKTSFGLGLIAGPTIGGALFEVGGFTLPFLVLGSLLFLCAIITVFLLPIQSADLESSTVLGQSFFAAFRVPSMVIAGFAVTSTSITIGFTAAFLELHLRQFNLPPTLTGLMFIVSGGVYALTSPIWGYLCDTVGQPKLLTGFAAISMCVAFLFIGPASFFPFDTKLWLSIVALIFQGIGIGGELVAAYIDALQEVIKFGFPNNVNTYGLVNGVWNSLFALGAFIGPSVGGVLYEKVGFRMASVVVLILHVIVALLFFVYHFMKKTHRR